MNYLSLCLIAKNENEYLAEWVDYHILLGVEHFYLYDNQSSVPIRDALKNYVESGWITVVDIEGKGMQLHAYDHCLQTFGKNSNWIGFIDTDEFLVPKTTTNLPEFLKDYEPYAGLAVSSLFFGPGGNQKKPAGGQIASYRLRMENGYALNRLIKCLMQPAKTLWPVSPHLFDTAENTYIVNENLSRVDSQKFPHSIEKIQLNHYYTRSVDEIKAKLDRGRGDAGAPYREARFKSIIGSANTRDVEILTLLSKITPQADLLVLEHNRPDLEDKKLLETIHRMALQKSNRPLAAVTRSPIKFVRRQTFADISQKNVEAVDAIEKRDWENAREIEVELIKEQPQCVSHLTDLAFICIQQNDFQTAWQVIARAWKMAPQSYLVLQIMSDFYNSIGDFTWVEKISQMMIAQAPQEISTYYALTNALLHQGQVEKGLALSLTILPELFNSTSDDQIRAVRLTKTIQPHLLARGEKRKLIEMLQLAIQIDHTDMSLYAVLIQLFHEMKDNRNAKIFLSKALKIDPTHTEILNLKSAFKI